MNEIPTTIKAWQMSFIEKGSQKRKLEECEITLPEIQPGEVLVKVAGCGVCGTDISLFYENIHTISRPPLTLGHEVSGTVIAGEKKWLRKMVIVPTIMPCNTCELCRAGRSNRCLSQKMLGYSYGPYGGFSSHIVVPAEDLCEIPPHIDFTLENLAVVADAVATPYQAARRSELREGDKVIIIGVTGGLGVYMAQWARFLGADVVIGIGRNEEKLESVKDYGIDLVVNAHSKSNLDIQSEIWSFCRKRRINPKTSWKIYEMSGTAEGQSLGLELLKYTGMLIIVGYGMNELTFNLSKLMAFDSEIIGTWGCMPHYYPFILEKVLEGHIHVRSLVETRPLSAISETFQEIRQGRKSLKRIVLLPD